MSDIVLPPKSMYASAKTEITLDDVLARQNSDLAQFARDSDGAAEAFVYLAKSIQQFARRHGLRPQEIKIEDPRTLDGAGSAQFRMTITRA